MQICIDIFCICVYSWFMTVKYPIQNKYDEDRMWLQIYVLETLSFNIYYMPLYKYILDETMYWFNILPWLC